MESFEHFGLKIGICSCFNENMKICDYKRSRSYLTKNSYMLTILHISSKATVTVGMKTDQYAMLIRYPHTSSWSHKLFSIKIFVSNGQCDHEKEVMVTKI